MRPRIAQAFLGNRALTTSQLAAELDDVPARGLYRYVALLAKAEGSRWSLADVARLLGDFDRYLATEPKTRAETASAAGSPLPAPENTSIETDSRSPSSPSWNAATRDGRSSLGCPTRVLGRRSG